MTTSEELYQKGVEITKRFRGGDASKVPPGSPSYDVIPGLRQLVTEWVFGSSWSRPVLDIKHRSMATISALTVLGREPQLKNHIRNALNLGLSKEQVSEVILHVMFTGGVPASLNALQIARQVFDERPDVPYNPDPIVPAATAEERLQQAVNIRRKIYGEGGPKPVIRHGEVADMEYARLNIGYFFGTIWSRPALDLKSRVICTLSAQTVLRLEHQIPNHVKAALNVGLTKEQIMEVFNHLMFYGGWDASINAMALANDVFYGRV